MARRCFSPMVTYSKTNGRQSRRQIIRFGEDVAGRHVNALSVGPNLRVRDKRPAAPVLVLY